MANPNRLKMIQAAQAKILRRKGPARPRPHKETAAEEMREGSQHEVAESPEFERREHGGKRSGSTTTAGSAVGGGA